MSGAVQPHRRQPTRLPHPWDSPGKNTGVGCHFLLQCMKGKSESEVSQLYATLSDTIDGSPPGSPIPGILQARTRVGCHFLLQCMKVKSESEVAQSCLTNLRPHGLQPTRLLRPRDFPSKETNLVTQFVLLHQAVKYKT